MSGKSDIQETADDLKNLLVPPGEDGEAGADEIGRVAQNTLGNAQGPTESARINAESKAKTLRSKGRASVRRQSFSVLPMLVAVLLVGLLIFFGRVASLFSGNRKSGNRPRRRAA